MAGKKVPTVMDGLRGPRSTWIDEKIKSDQDSAAQFVAPAPEIPDATVYISKYPGLRIQVAAGDDTKDPYTGKLVKKGLCLAAQFDNGIFVNRHNSKSPEIRDLIDRELQSMKEFGAVDDKGRIPAQAHFWLSSDAEKVAQVAKLESARRTLATLPEEVKQEFLAQLAHGTAVDHKLPQRAAQENA